jgi:putative oxygen-independent coproporphyrinogen III oxidase
VIGIYVHIPFCVRKCFYCDFNSGPAAEPARERYVAALCGEIRQSPYRGQEARTLFFGGGTPSELDGRQLGAIAAALRETFPFAPQAEWTIEANPGTVTQASLAEMRGLGFNRISLGVQSFHDYHLTALGRIHTASEAVEAFRWAGEAGFASRNIDLIFGIPNHTMAEWETDLAKAVSLAPEHISLYGLTIEAGTEFGRRHAAGQLPMPDEDIAAEMYERTIDTLAAAGYEQYEISNWARPGHRCRHNQIYWRNEPYLGFGISAAYYMDGARWTNVGNPRVYEERAAAGSSCIQSEERLTGARAAGEAVMLGLRTLDGVNLDELSVHYGLDLRRHFDGAIRRMTGYGLLEETDNRLRLTRPGLLLSNNVFCEFL